MAACEMDYFAWRPAAQVGRSGHLLLIRLTLAGHCSREQPLRPLATCCRPAGRLWAVSQSRSRSGKRKREQSGRGLRLAGWVLMAQYCTLGPLGQWSNECQSSGEEDLAGRGKSNKWPGTANRCQWGRP